jgi:hypothetical protein
VFVSYVPGPAGHCAKAKFANTIKNDTSSIFINLLTSEGMGISCQRINIRRTVAMRSLMVLPTTLLSLLADKAHPSILPLP